MGKFKVQGLKLQVLVDPEAGLQFFKVNNPHSIPPLAASWAIMASLERPARAKLPNRERAKVKAKIATTEIINKAIIKAALFFIID